MKRYLSVLGCLLLVSLVRAETATEPTVLKRKGRQPEPVNLATYSHFTKEYRVTFPSGATTVIRATDVEYCKPPMPRDFDSMTNNIEGLERIVQDCRGLWWDVEAFKRLMPLYLKERQHAKAVNLFQEMAPALGQDMPPSLHKSYWTALLETEQGHVLGKELEERTAGSQRELCALAYLMRGDLLLKRNKPKEALVDGYLKVVILFADIKEIRQEALEKAVAVMEELRDPRAETFRKLLRQEFPDTKKTP